jgi:DNA-binding response OmpR family regulator
MIRNNIIVIDDELLIRDLLYDFFSERNWVVSVSESGEKCSELLKNRAYDIALVDIKMPEEDGLSLIRKMRALYPSMAIVIITGFPSVETAVEALRLKVDDYFIKPFNINKLYKTIESLVEQRRERKETIPVQDFPL